MTCPFETLGNASVQVCENGRAILTTDPSLRGIAEKISIKPIFKRLYRGLIGDPVRG